MLGTRVGIRAFLSPPPSFLCYLFKRNAKPASSRGWEGEVISKRPWRYVNDYKGEGSSEDTTRFIEGGAYTDVSISLSCASSSLPPPTPVVERGSVWRISRHHSPLPHPPPSPPHVPPVAERFQMKADFATEQRYAWQEALVMQSPTRQGRSRAGELREKKKLGLYARRVALSVRLDKRTLYKNLKKKPEPLECRVASRKECVYAATWPEFDARFHYGSYVAIPWSLSCRRCVVCGCCEDSEAGTGLGKV